MRFRAPVASIFVSFLVLVALSSGVRASGIGFQAGLDYPDTVVSRFSDVQYQFSAALYPQSHATLSPQLAYNPTVRRGDFDSHYLVFNTDYKQGKTLIPVAVDADQFLSYQLERSQDRQLTEAIRKNRFTGKQQGGRSGINLGVALPKRLDRMFGEGGGNLKVSGYRRITFSGRSQWADGATSDLARQSKFPSLNMQQMYQFNIEGTIGSKISVKVSEDSQTDIPLANRLIIRYKGDDDDIVKAIEAGNTTLDLPNTRFVGYSSRVQGLFGFKTVAQVGRLKFTGIMSQEKGSSERASVSGSGAQTASTIRDYAYAENRVFDLAYPGEMQAEDSVTEVLVFEQLRPNATDAYGSAWFLVDPSQPDSNVVYADSQRVSLLQGGTDYEIRWNRNTNDHYLIFKSARSPNLVIGIYMEYRRASDGQIVAVGRETTESSPVWRLRMLRPGSDSYKPNHPTWGLMWRNVYNAPKVENVEDLGVKIFKGKPGMEESTSSLDYQDVNGKSEGYFLAILGLDQYNTSNNNTPDKKMDDRPEVYDRDNGLIIFPSRTPFDDNRVFTYALGAKSNPLALRVPNIYRFNSSTERTEASQYFIQITSRVKSSNIRLNRTNIIQGSERVIWNGQLLNRDTDYKVDYSFGQITILKQQVLDDPNGNLNVEFEYAPFLSLQKKSLLGMRAEYEWSPDLRFGSTILYKSDKAQQRKPRVGQETAQMTVFDFDGRFRINTGFMTAIADAVPLVSTDAASSLTVSGEVARSYPNPNINGAAFVDDFESASDQSTLGMTRTNWTVASRPKQLTPDYVPAYLPDSSKHVKLLWHNPPQPRVDEVYQRDNPTGQGQTGTIQTLRLILKPDTMGTSPSWAGIMTYFGNRVDAKRVRLLEVRVKGNRGKLHFDVGRINEDVNGDGDSKATEDIDGNRVVTEIEDVGIDRISNAAEPGFHEVDNPDPSNDNWYFKGQGIPPVPPSRIASQAFQDSMANESTPLYYEWLNGTEGNSIDLASQSIPDHENLSSNGNLIDNYFSYSIDLASDSFLLRGSELNDWRTYRIPVRKEYALDTVIGSPVWSDVLDLRVWMEAPPRSHSDTMFDTVEVAAWYFVQSNWADSIALGIPPADTLTRGASKYYVATVSTEDKTFYAPPGVSAYTDPTTKAEEPQRGLAMVYTLLYPKDTCLAVKNLLAADTYTGYSKLEMYVHGDDFSQPDSLRFFFRAGTDSLNYYEYHTYVRSGWQTGNAVSLSFDSATAIKDAAQRRAATLNSPVNDSAGSYRVFGRPSLNQIVYFAAGLVNEGDVPISGQVWLDELRVTNVHRDVGTAARMDFQGNMGDLISYSFQWYAQDPYFRGISAATRGGSTDNLGSGSSDQNYSYSLSLNFDKFLPRSWGARIPVGYSSSHSIKRPLLRTGSDILLQETVRDLERTESSSRSLSISENFSAKGKNPVFNLLLNRQNAGFSYSRSENRMPTSPYSFGESYNVRADYNMGWSQPPTLPILFWTKPIPYFKRAAVTKLGLYPHQWQWSATFNRTLSVADDINDKRTSSLTRTLDGRMSLAYKLFESLQLNYSIQSRRDLSNPNDVNLKLGALRLGLETNYSQNFSSTYSPKVLGFLTTAFGYTTTYSDTYDRGTTARNSSLSNNYSVSGSFRHMVLLSPGKPQSGGGDQGGRSTPGSAQEEKPRKPFYDPPLALMRLLTGWIQPISYKYGRSFSNTLPGMAERPGMAYRFGFDRLPKVASISQSRVNTASEGETYELGTNFTLLGGIGTDLKFRRGITRDLVSQGTRYRSTTTAWPDMSIRIGRFTNPPILKDVLNKLIQVFSPQTGYDRTVKEVYSISGGYYTAKSVSKDYSPLLAINFKVFRSMSLTASYSLNKTEEQRYNSVNGSLASESRTTRKNIALSTGYRFSAPSGIRIPLLGKMKVTSSVQIDLRVQRNDSKSENSAAGGPFTVNTDYSDFSVSPQISYNFSQSLKGGLTGTWADRNDRYAGRKSHTRELQIFAEIRF